MELTNLAGWNTCNFLHRRSCVFCNIGGNYEQYNQKTFMETKMVYWINYFYVPRSCGKFSWALRLRKRHKSKE